jgi:hypothetical protein
MMRFAKFTLQGGCKGNRASQWWNPARGVLSHVRTVTSVFGGGTGFSAMPTAGSAG